MREWMAEAEWGSKEEAAREQALRRKGKVNGDGGMQRRHMRE